MEKAADIYGFLKNKKNLRERLIIESRYEKSVAEQQEEISEVKKEESLKIPLTIDYSSTYLHFTKEVRERLEYVRPTTVRKL